MSDLSAVDMNLELKYKAKPTNQNRHQSIFNQKIAMSPIRDQEDNASFQNASLIDQTSHGSPLQEERRFSLNIDRISQTLDIKNISEMKVPDLKEKFLHLLKENEQLVAQLEQKDRQVKEYKVALLNASGKKSDDNSKSMNISQIITSLGNHNASQNELDISTVNNNQKQEISKLNCEKEILQAQLSTKDSTIEAQKDEIKKLTEQKEKWIRKLDEEIERNAANVAELNAQINELQDINFKQEFELNQR
jgi:predicted nuclease with TOPRIM domain